MIPTSHLRFKERYVEQWIDGKGYIVKRTLLQQWWCFPYDDWSLFRRAVPDNPDWEGEWRDVPVVAGAQSELQGEVK